MDQALKYLTLSKDLQKTINVTIVLKDIVEQIAGKIVGLTIKASKLPKLYI